MATQTSQPRETVKSTRKNLSIGKHDSVKDLLNAAPGSPSKRTHSQLGSNEGLGGAGGGGDDSYNSNVGGLRDISPARQQQKAPTCWLTDVWGISVPPSLSAFAYVGKLMKRRGGFGKMAQNNWKPRCFVLMKQGHLCYFDEDEFSKVDFTRPPRGIINIAEGGSDNVSISTRMDYDVPGQQHTITIQVKNERWKLCAETEQEVMNWSRVLTEARDHLSMLNGASIGSNHSSVDARYSSVGRGGGGGGGGFGGVGGNAGFGGDPYEAVRMERERRKRESLSSSFKGSESGGVSFLQRRNSQQTLITQQQLQQAESDLAGRIAQGFMFVVVSVNACCILIHAWKPSEIGLYAMLFLLDMVIGFAILGVIGQGRAKTKRDSSSGGGGGGGMSETESANINVPLVHRMDVRAIVAGVKRMMKSVTPAETDGVIEKVEVGSTMKQWEGPVDPNEWVSNDRSMAHTWCDGRGPIFKVRGDKYMEDGKKVESDSPMYELLGVDLFATEARVDHIAHDFKLDAYTQGLPAVDPSTQVPALLVINVQLPSAPPLLIGGATDGPGTQVVFYFRITEQTVKAMENPAKASSAVRLWMDYAKKADTDAKFKGRFKVIAVVHNLDDLGLSQIARFNGKPVLINKSGLLFSGGNYLECDINVHNFGFPAKKGLHGLQDKFKEMILHVGFTIEGRAPDELPETILGAAQFNFPDLSKALEYEP